MLVTLIGLTGLSGQLKSRNNIIVEKNGKLNLC